MKYVFRAWYKNEPYKFTQRVINDKLFFVMENDECKYSFYIPFIDSDWTVEQFTDIYDSTTWEELTNQERSDWLWEGNTLNEWKGKMVFEGDIVKCHALTSDETVVIKIFIHCLENCIGLIFIKMALEKSLGIFMIVLNYSKISNSWGAQ